MVYCGKPSQFCGGCRKRRIKCDKREPSCSQCLKKGMICPGYRNLLDLAFRDETSAIVKKVHKDDSHRSSLDTFRSRNLELPISEVAKCHFLNSYATFGSHFSYLHELFGKTSSTNPLISSTIATALANLSRERREPEIMRTARLFYCQALKQTHAAVQSNEVQSDSTLASVMVLALFDVIALDGQMSATSWETHIEGALSLLEIRGVELLKTQVGRQMYIQMSNNIRVGCLQRAIPLPPKFVEIDKEASAYLDSDHPILRFWAIVDKFVDLQVMIKDKDQFQPMKLIQQSLDIERMAVTLADSLEMPWQYEILDPEEAPQEAFQQTAHRYSNFVIPRFWNTIRMTRIFVNEVIWEQAGIMQKAEEEQDLEFWRCMQELSLQNAQEMAIDILATVPQFIKRPINEREKAPLQATVVNGFVWPLSAVGRSELLPLDVRKYAIDALYIIGNEAKLSQAVKVAALLENGKVPLTWLHIFHLA